MNMNTFNSNDNKKELTLLLILQNFAFIFLYKYVLYYTASLRPADHSDLHFLCRSARLLFASLFSPCAHSFYSGSWWPLSALALCTPILLLKLMTLVCSRPVHTDFTPEVDDRCLLSPCAHPFYSWSWWSFSALALCTPILLLKLMTLVCSRPVHTHFTPEADDFCRET